MSYTKTVNVEIKADDLAQLEKAATDLGLVFKRDSKRYRTHEGTRACEHEIVSTFGHHTIGVVRSNQPGVYNLSADFYGHRQLAEAVGSEFEILMQRYSTNVAKDRLYAQGAREIREEFVEDDQRVRLVATF